MRVTASPPDVIPAATVIVMRDVPGDLPDLLMVERAATMAFAGGALVFPGGRVDPGDHALASEMGCADIADAAARIAAIRETLEEAGIMIGFRSPPIDPIALRARLHAGAGLGDAMPDAADTIDPGTLVPFARWRPQFEQTRMFDTRFYLASLPQDAPAPKVDATENVRAFWATAAAVLAAADAGRAQIIYPTRRNLERLATYRSHADALADAAAYPIRTITPWVAERGGASHLCIPEDLGYPVTSEPMSAAIRG